MSVPSTTSVLGWMPTPTTAKSHPTRVPWLVTTASTRPEPAAAAATGNGHRGVPTAGGHQDRVVRDGLAVGQVDDLPCSVHPSGPRPQEQLHVVLRVPGQLPQIGSVQRDLAPEVFLRQR